MNFFKRIKNYISESYTELMHKVSWPTWNELQSSSIIVMIASVIFALIVLAMDLVFKYGVSGIYSIFS
ncbi:MAG TPA: preprotein translocase subunit SecE [Bacteroidales bacterium]|nr:preprotein translocase subunit SecE [Bacteroidales bacterium]